MGLLGDLFRAKGIAEVRVTVTRLPKGAAYRYRVGFVEVTDPDRPRPQAAPDDTRWTGFTERNTCDRKLPAAAYYVVVVVQPILRGSDGAARIDKNRQVPFWPLEKPVTISAGNTSIVRVDIVFPAAGLG